MSIAAALIPELDHEAGATRRLLERVPADRLDLKPHPRSMSLGQLALHIAAIPGSISRLASLDGIDTLTVDFTPASPASAAELLPTLEKSLAAAKAYLAEPRRRRLRRHLHRPRRRAGWFSPLPARWCCAI